MFFYEIFLSVCWWSFGLVVGLLLFVSQSRDVLVCGGCGLVVLMAIPFQCSPPDHRMVYTSPPSSCVQTPSTSSPQPTVPTRSPSPSPTPTPHSSKNNSCKISHPTSCVAGRNICKVTEHFPNRIWCNR